MPKEKRRGGLLDITTVTVNLNRSQLEAHFQELEKELKKSQSKNDFIYIDNEDFYIK